MLTPILGHDSGPLILVLFYVPILAWAFILARRRLHDMDYSGWLCLLLIVPVANFVLGLMLLLKGGTEGKNKYDKQPGPNSPWIWLSVLIVPAIGILAAVALPAYQNYTKRAKMAQEAQQSPPLAPPTTESGDAGGK